MCMSCMTASDALLWNSLALAGMGAPAVRRVRDAACGRSPMERRRDTYDRNCEFVRSLGLDPRDVLGLPPA